MKIRLLYFFIFIKTVILAQGDPRDIVTPQDSPFESGENRIGSGQADLNEATGKLSYTVPISTINCRKMTQAINLNYSTKTAIDQATKTNKYSPTGVAGVGFSINESKIIVDNKNTATIEDDVFYLQNGGASNRLICIKREAPTSFPYIGETYLEFKTESFIPWKIRYIIRETTKDFNIKTTELDYWELIDDNGLKHIYGKTTDSKEKVVAWGNWIGSSIKNSGGTSKTIAWNLNEINDEWNNQIKFKYKLQEQTMGGAKQTEASYLSEIESGTGEKIKLNYLLKNYYTEIHEPNIEKAEPDAYQERYEKYYLDNIKTYNSKAELIYTYDLIYDVIFVTTGTISNNRKRFLTEIVQSNKNNEALPPLKIEYNTTGTFSGCIKSISSPMGGVTRYKYQNKYLFNNRQNILANVPNDNNYHQFGFKANDSYSISFVCSTKPITGTTYNFKMNRFVWNGKKWEVNEYVLPEKIEIVGGYRLKDFKSFFGTDFYGYTYRRDGRMNIHLFHLAKDGKTWIEKHDYNIYIGEGEPTILDSNDFFAVGTHRSGQLYLYYWNGDDWVNNTINQGVGQYYYGAANNYIIALNEDGGPDIFSKKVYRDNFYFHYLDVTKAWQTKSWSEKASNYIGQITAFSSFSSDNSVIGFIAANNDEFLLNWSTTYSLNTPDDIGKWNDQLIFTSTTSSMLTLQSTFGGATYYSSRFDGSEWHKYRIDDFGFYDIGNVSYGVDNIGFQSRDGDIGRLENLSFNPNTNKWTLWNLGRFNHSTLSQLTSFNQDFMIAGNRVYGKSRYSGNYLSQTKTLDYTNNFCYSDGLNHSFIKLVDDNKNFVKSQFLYIDKTNNTLSSIDILGKHEARTESKGAYAGKYPFLSPKSIWLSNPDNGTKHEYDIYRIIEDKFKNSIYDIVVSDIEYDNGKGVINKINYTYEGFNCSTDNENTFYEKVTKRNKGLGSFNNGYLVTNYNNGQKDVRYTGLKEAEYVYDEENKLKSKRITTWGLSTKSNSIFENSSYIRPRDETQYKYYSDGSNNLKKTIYEFGVHGKITRIYESSNDNNEIYRTTNTYSTESFLEDKNIITNSDNYTQLVEGQFFWGKNYTNYSRIVWKQYKGKAFPSQTWSGISLGQLRLISEITKVDDFGNTIESNNGNDEYTSILYGYNSKFPVATITNAKYQDAIDALDISNTILQKITDNDELKSELIKLYDRLPNAMIRLTFYDDLGRITSIIDERKEAVYSYYDSFGRLDYVADSNNKVISKNVYNYKIEEQ